MWRDTNMELVIISRKQQEEIDFFCGTAKMPFIPTQEEIEEYINETVHGKKTYFNESNLGNSISRIGNAKRNFDITISMWREDLVNGLLSIDELYEDEEFKEYPFAKRLIDSVLKSLDFNKYKYKSGVGFPQISAFNAMKKHEIHSK